MANFKEAFAASGKHEGGYVNHPSDPGGETYAGVTRRDHPNWKGWQYIVAGKITNKVELDKLVEELFKKEYWDTFNGDLINATPIAKELYDTGLNMGVGIAETFLQRALNVTNKNQTLYANLKVDGDVGPKTIAVLNAHPDPKLVFKILNLLQGARYVALCEANEKLEDFTTGWINNRVTLNY